MKKLINILFIAVLGTSLFASCSKNDDFDPEAIRQAGIKADKQLDSLFTEQAKEIVKYKDLNMPNAIEDTVKRSFQYIDRTIKRGIWYEVMSEPTDDKYEYKVQIVNDYYSSYLAVVLPKVKLKYTAKLLDGTVVQQDAEGTTYDLATTGDKIFNQAWRTAFIPYSLKYNGETKIFEGLTEKGLKAGSKIRLITPSHWAFRGVKVGEIPANSPLVYEFEVLEIN